MLTSALYLLIGLGTIAGALPAPELRLPTRGPVAPAPACAKNVGQKARQGVLSALPPGFRLMGVVLSSGCVPAKEAPLTCEAQVPEALQEGRSSWNVTCTGSGGRRYALKATVDLLATVAAKGAVIVARGAEVKIVVRSGNVTVQAAAIAQENAGLNETIQVLPSGGTKVVRGRVLDARTVEVTL